jgi:hypothetical protein
MLNIEMPDDLISLSLYNIFTYRKNDKKFIKHIKDWNKKVVLHITPFYPITVIFQRYSYDVRHCIRKIRSFQDIK